MSQKRLKIGLFGFGCVGRGLYSANEKAGFPLEIVKVCVRRPDIDRGVDGLPFTLDSEDLLLDENIDIIVEATDDPVAAFSIAERALLNGKSVVTASKQLVATRFSELRQLQQQSGGAMLYEAACCASIPVIRTLDSYFAGEPLKKIQGILNGSTNYILDRIFEGGLSFAGALREAQDLGFAESDPWLDIEAYDPAFKLAILSAHAFGLRPKPGTLLRRGIGGLGPEERAFADANGWKLRLVAEAGFEGGAFFARVLPRFLSKSNPLAGTRAENNALLIEGHCSGDQFLQGKGAGSLPTGAALLADILAAGEGKVYRYPKGNAEISCADTLLPVYIRIPGEPAWTGWLKTSRLREFLETESGKRAVLALLPESYREPLESIRELNIAI